MNWPRQNWVRVLIGVGLAGLLGLGVFATLAWRATSLKTALPPAAAREFDAVTRRFGDAAPRILLVAEDGAIRNPAAPPAIDGPVTMLVVMVYRADSHKLVRTEVPFWFFRLKGSAAQLALRNSGFDLRRLGLRPADVASEGPGIIFTEKTPEGDRVLVWAE